MSILIDEFDLLADRLAGLPVKAHNYQLLNTEFDDCFEDFEDDYDDFEDFEDDYDDLIDDSANEFADYDEYYRQPYGPHHPFWMYDYDPLPPLMAEIVKIYNG